MIYKEEIKEERKYKEKNKKTVLFR